MNNHQSGDTARILQLEQENTDQATLLMGTRTRILQLKQENTELRQRETEFAKEREDLQRLIQGNADRRIQEFRNSVGGPLRRLLNRVPDRGAPVSSELGAVLLARLHEVIDELESKGIRARSVGD